MSIEKTSLLVPSTGERVEAEFHTLLGLGELFDAEAQWAPVRIEVLKRFYEAKVPDGEWPRSFHWNWAAKAAQLRKLDVRSALSPVRLMGLRTKDGQWQGMIMAKAVGHVTRNAPPGRELVYVDYIEIAPWNLEFKGIGQEPRLKGAGRQLMEAVVRLSDAMDFGGRVGLHSLEQSERVYRRWGMTDLGPDASYASLRYFEMSEAQAKAFLRER